MELKPKAQRGSLLSSIVMVMLATVATGMLAFIGFQALPDSVIPATFGGDERSSRHVNVSDSPAPPPEQAHRPTAVPSTKPPVPVETASPHATGRPSHASQPTREGSNTNQTAKPQPVATSSAPKPAPTTTTAPPKVSPSPSQSTQTASPAPSCGTGRKPRCPRSAEPASSPTRQATYSDTSYGDASYAPTKSSTDARKAGKATAPGKAGTARKPATTRR